VLVRNWLISAEWLKQTERSWFISIEAAPFHTTVINVGRRDATYVLDGLLHHEHDIRNEHYTDTAGIADHVFALDTSALHNHLSMRDRFQGVPIKQERFIATSLPYRVRHRG
jgi:hypothetical protein